METDLWVTPKNDYGDQWWMLYVLFLSKNDCVSVPDMRCSVVPNLRSIELVVVTIEPVVGALSGLLTLIGP